MSDKRSLLSLGERAVLARSDHPIAHTRPVVAVVDRLSARWAGDAISHALSARGARVARLSAILRVKEGAEQAADQVRASPEAMPEALAHALATLPAHDVVVIEGTAAVALVVTRLAILASATSVLSLPPDVRALRGCFDLVLFTERGSVLERVAASLWPADA